MHSVEITQFFNHSYVESNLEEPKVSKSDILTHLEALNFDFYDFAHFLDWNLPNQQNQEPKNCKKNPKRHL